MQRNNPVACPSCRAIDVECCVDEFGATGQMAALVLLVAVVVVVVAVVVVLVAVAWETARQSDREGA